MHSHPAASVVFLICLMLTGLATAQDDWSQWRGPNGNGIAADGQTPPTEWDSEKNVVWKVKVPGRGHASPIVVGNKIFLTSADEDDQTQSVLCFDRKTGEMLWDQEISQGQFDRRIHGKNTHATPTVATDGKHVFAVFSHHGHVEIVALDFDGKQVWKKQVGVYQGAYPFGYGASPIVYDGQVIVTNENKGDSAIVAYEGETGKERWRIGRDGLTSYSTPVVTRIDGKLQMLLSGGKQVAGFNPENGKKLWSVPASWTVTCGTVVWDGKLVFASGGYPTSQTLAVNVSTGETVWENRTKVYEQSMLAHDGYIYAHSDNSAIYCWRAKDGKEMWKQRFRSPESVSPVLANGNIYFTDERGNTLVVKATPQSFVEVARNQLGDETFASPAFCGNQIFTRIADSSTGERQEWLVCLGEK